MDMKFTRLEKAKKLFSKRQITRFTDEEIAMAIAWLKDEVGLSALAKVLYVSTAEVQQKMAVRLREAYRRGIIKAK